MFKTCLEATRSAVTVVLLSSLALVSLEMCYVLYKFIETM